MPYLPDERQYRNFAASNFQPVQRDDTDSNDEPSYIVEGHFTVFEAPYELLPGFFETIDRHALDETDMSDVLFQFNHRGMVLARQRNHSLQVGIDSVGGLARADLSGCQQARELYEAISNGLVDRMSFGFTIADDGFEWEEDEDGTIHTRITKIAKLFDVSAVDLPASEHTDISARSFMDSIIEARSKQQENSNEKQEDATKPQPEETRSSQAENSIEDVAVNVDGESYEGVEDVTVASESYGGDEIQGVVEGFDLEDMATRIASILAKRSVKEVSEQIKEKLSGPEQEVSEPVSDSKARRMRRARALQLSHI